MDFVSTSPSLSLSQVCVKMACVSLSLFSHTSRPPSALSQHICEHESRTMYVCVWYTPKIQLRSACYFVLVPSVGSSRRPCPPKQNILLFLYCYYVRKRKKKRKEIRFIGKDRIRFSPIKIRTKESRLQSPLPAAASIIIVIIIIASL